MPLQVSDHCIHAFRYLPILCHFMFAGINKHHLYLFWNRGRFEMEFLLQYDRARALLPSLLWWVEEARATTSDGRSLRSILKDDTQSWRHLWLTVAEAFAAGWDILRLNCPVAAESLAGKPNVPFDSQWCCGVPGDLSHLSDMCTSTNRYRLHAAQVKGERHLRDWHC